MLFTYTYRGKQRSLDLPETASVKEFQQALVTKERLPLVRQAVKLVSASNPTIEHRFHDVNKGLAAELASFAAKHDSEGTIVVKDIGPQFSYQGVFVIEYAGPIVIMLLAALRPAWLYPTASTAQPYSPVALLGVLLWVGHFVKREAETLFVHIFSRPTMPLFNLFKNCWYYWAFALFVAYPLCSPEYTPPTNPARVAFGAVLMIASEVVNFAVHWQLRSMRHEGSSTSRAVPKGALFQYVSCPNYTAEILCWVGFSIATNILASWAFTVVGCVQMSIWALQKHKGYLKQEPTLRRKAIIPFVL